MNRWPWVLSFLTFFIFQTQLQAQSPAGPIVREIEVRFDGPETVNRAVVMANVQTAVGKPRVRDVVEQDVRGLIATGFFFDVRVLEEPVADGVKIIFQLRGKATLKEVVFEGNKVFKSERLKRETALKPGDILDERRAHADSLKMAELYQKGGWADIKVEPVVTIDADTSKAILKFKVTEGERVLIRQVVYTGLKAYQPGELNKLVKTRRRWMFSWLGGTGVLKDEQFLDDLEKIRDHYRSHGYIDMEIKTNYVDRVSPKWMDIHIDIFEGQQYKVGELKIEGNTLYPTAELRRRLRMGSGQIFTPEGFSKDLEALEDYYGARGYMDTSVRSTRVPNIETGQLDITYTIKEGSLTYVEKIIIRGNTKTKDKVIRRELALAPGDVYNTVRVNASKERLKNLNYFEKVEATPEPTTVPNRRDLAVQVTEQRTGNVTFGAGFSSIDNLIGFIEVTQGNFDLFNWPSFTGGGQKLRVRAQVGIKRQDYVVSFVEPWFLDQRLLLGVDLFHHRSGFLSSRFDEARTGAALKLERSLSEFIRAGVRYSIQNIDLTVSRLSSEELRSQEGALLRSGVETTLTYDSRNSVFLTTRGNRTELSAELVGGPVGGDVSIYKLNGKTTFYFPFFNNHVLQLLAAGGTVDAFGQSKGRGPIVDEDPSPFVNFVKVNDVPIFDRYFLGGADTLRGFGFRKIGPRDARNDPVGGNTYVNGTAEYSFPIVERVRGAFFFDVGEVQRDAFSFSAGDLKSDAGIGVRLNLPVGPLRLDYGYPLMTDKQAGRGGKFQFSVGYQF